MSETKHTPGPWTGQDYGYDYNAYYIIDIYGDGGEVCSVKRCAFVPIPGETLRVHRDVSEIKANARLISAAPELLEALQAMSDVCKMLWSAVMRDDSYVIPSEVSDALQPMPEAYKTARAAIAKATGKEVANG